MAYTKGEFTAELNGKFAVMTLQTMTPEILSALEPGTTLILEDSPVSIGVFLGYTTQYTSIAWLHVVRGK